MRIEIKAIRWLTVTLLSLPGLALWAGGGGNILGTIKDPSGSPIANAKVTATETATGLKQSLTTDGRGFYSFASLAVGHYNVQVDASGFKPYRRTNVAIDVDSKVVVDAALVIGEMTETVTVSEAVNHLDTVEGPIVRQRNVLQLLEGFRKSDVKYALAEADAFAKKLQRERGLAGARISFHYIETVCRQTSGCDSEF